MKNVILSLLYCLTTCLQAQVTMPTNFDVAEIAADFKRVDAIRHYQDREKRHYFIGLFQSNVYAKTRIVQTDSVFKVLKNEFKETQVLGSVSSDFDFIDELDDRIVFHLYSRLSNNHSQEGMKVYVLYKKSLAWVETSYFNTPSKEAFSCTFTDGGDTKILVTASTKKDSLFFYAIDSDLQIVRTAIDCTPLKLQDFKSRFHIVTSMGMVSTTPKSTLFNLFGFKNWNSYYREQSDLDNASAKNKVFMAKNQCFFLSDLNKERPFSELVTIDLVSKTATKQTIYPDVASLYKVNEYNITSNIFNGKIFIGYADRTYFQLDIKDFASLKTLKSYHFSNNDTIGFKNAPLSKLERKDKGWFKKNVKDSLNLLKDNKLFFEKLTTESFGIKIVEADKDMELMIGAVETIWKTSYNAMSMSASGMMMGGGSTELPIGYNTYAFKSLINAETLDHNPNKQVLIVTDFQKFTNKAKGYSDVQSTVSFMGTDKLFFCYYNKSRKKLIVTADMIAK
jgi:hypothetical protein